MNTNLSRQYLPLDTALHRLDARGKLLGFLLLTAAVVLTDTLAGFGLMLALAAMLVLWARLPLGAVLGAVRQLFWFSLIVFLLNALFYSRQQPLWQWWIFSLTKAGMLQGANIVARICLIVLFSTILTMTTPPMALTGALGSLLRPLRLLRVPVEQVALILSVAIQFIPILRAEAAVVKKAQTARGARFESKHIFHRIGAVPPLLIPIFLSAFKRADELSDAMEARGYRGAAHRTKRCPTPFPCSGWLTVILCAGVCALQTFLF